MQKINRQVPSVGKRKYVYYGLCVTTLAALIFGVTQCSPNTAEDTKNTKTSDSEPFSKKDTSIKDKSAEKKKTPKSEKSGTERSEDILETFGIVPKTLPRYSAASGPLTSTELKEINTAYNKKKEEATEKSPLIGPVEKGQNETEKPKEPELPVIPGKPNPVVTAPKISLLQETIVIGQYSPFNPLYYFSISDGGDPDTVVNYNSIDSSVLGQQSIKITAKNKAGYDEKEGIVYVNGLPKIDLKEKEIDVPIRSEVDLLTYAYGYDPEEGDITENLIIDTDLQRTKVGEYTVKYTYVDSFGFSAESDSATIRVTNEAPVIHAENSVIEMDQPFDPLVLATARDREDGVIPLTAENIIKNEVKTDTEGTYEVIYGNIKDQDGLSAENVTIQVQVLNEAPVVVANDYKIPIGGTVTLEKLLQSIKVTDREDDRKGIPVKVTLDEASIASISTISTGQFTIPGVAEDSHGKQTDFTLTVSVRNEAPVFHGVDDVLIDYGSVFDIKAGVTVTDFEDGTIPISKVTIVGSVNTLSSGKYIVTYIVSDSAGETTEKKRIVTVKEEVPPSVKQVENELVTSEQQVKKENNEEIAPFYLLDPFKESNEMISIRIEETKQSSEIQLSEQTTLGEED